MRPRRRVQRRTLHVSILDGFEQQRDAVAALEQRRNRAPARIRAVAAPVVENDLSRGRLVECPERIDGGGFELGRGVRFEDFLQNRRDRIEAPAAERANRLESAWRMPDPSRPPRRGRALSARQARNAGRLPMRPAAPRHCPTIAAGRMPVRRRAPSRFRAPTSRNPRVKPATAFQGRRRWAGRQTIEQAPPGPAARRSSRGVDQKFRVRPAGALRHHACERMPRPCPRASSESPCETMDRMSARGRARRESVEGAPVLQFS